MAFLRDLMTKQQYKQWENRQHMASFKKVARQILGLEPEEDGTWGVPAPGGQEFLEQAAADNPHAIKKLQDAK